MVKKTIKLIIFVGLVYGQSHFNGKWYKVGTNWQVHINIFETSEGQFLEQYMKIANNQNLLFKKKIIKPWIGESYTKTEYLDKSYNTAIHHSPSPTNHYQSQLASYLGYQSFLPR